MFGPDAISTPLDPDGDPVLFDAPAFDRALADGHAPVAIFRDALRRGDATLEAALDAGVGAESLVLGRARLIDTLITRAWARIVAPQAPDAALVAVGGYGRRELHPHSDVDVLILLPNNDYARHQEPVGEFLTLLWDMGLHVGHSVRSVEDCETAAAADITVATNLMEARRLAGPDALFQSLRRVVAPQQMWPSREFFEAKIAEQRRRHQKFDDTAYKLEPNIKEGPGGLRDLQVIGWVAKRHFGAETLDQLVTFGFLTPSEHERLRECQAFLWRVRYALHCLAQHREERLLFDYQTTLAARFGYRDNRQELAVEQFMQRYYRTIMELGRLNEMLLQLFEEAILLPGDDSAPVAINDRFQNNRGYIEARAGDVFRRSPTALLEVFLVAQQQPDVKGFRASTIRLIRDHTHLIDQRFREDPEARRLFMEILRQPRGITHELRRMNRYGVLAAYIPAFGRIVGRMQYDLFHVYTVDEHSLFVLRNLRRFAVPEFSHEFPECSRIIATLPKPELIYLAALFHDIAKGRGGDHSELGAREARAFCREHGLSDYDTRLVTWLVRHHLAMSLTAQRRDISDPGIINQFARRVGSKVRLDYLYLLTVADIRGTNPDLWNSWRHALLAELYGQTVRALRRGTERPMDRRERIREVQEQARARLRAEGVPATEVDRIWADLDDDYFRRHTADEVAWHTAAIADAREGALPLILVDRATEHGGTAVFLYARDADHLFALTTSTLDQLGLTVVDARIITSRSGYTMDTYLVLEENDTGTGAAEPTPQRYREIRDALRRQLTRPDPVPITVTRRAPRQFKHFPIETEVTFWQDHRNRRTVMELVTADRPGLLSQVALAFRDCRVRVHNAKIATFGARAEDIFYITDDAGHPLRNPSRFDALRHTLSHYLDRAA